MTKEEMFKRLFWWAKTSLEIMRDNGMSEDDEKNIKEVAEIKEIIAQIKEGKIHV